MGQTFEELIGQHLDDLFSAALCFTLDEHRAEELLQEASIRAFHEFPRGRGREVDFRQSMLAVLVSTHLQRQRRLGHDPLAAASAPREEALSARTDLQVKPFPDPGTAGYRLLRDWMNRVWSDLDEGDRLILWLADVERLRHRRVAEMIGIGEEQVRSRHYRARLILSQEAVREIAGLRSAAGMEA
jgi:RNA polymerase sigma factor (sigma-70 family)